MQLMNIWTEGPSGENIGRALDSELCESSHVPKVTRCEVVKHQSLLLLSTAFLLASHMFTKVKINPFVRLLPG